MHQPFHLAWFVSRGFSPKAWRFDWGDTAANWLKPDLFVDLARSLERPCFDYVIIEDSSHVPQTYRNSHDVYLKYAAATPKMDPAVLVPYMAQATKHIGIVPTLSTAEYPPYHLDHPPADGRPDPQFLHLKQRGHFSFLPLARARGRAGP